MSVSPPEKDDSAQRAPLSLIVELTREMLTAAGRSDWETVARYEEKRRQMIKQSFDVATGPKPMAELAASLEEILRLDRELITQAEAARSQYADQLSTLRKSKKALKAYRSPP